MKNVCASIAVIGLVLAMVPAASQAATLEEKQAANAANDIARCTLAAQGVALPGKIAPSTPAAADACAKVYTGVEARALKAVPSSLKIACPYVGPVTQAQLLPLWDYQIKKAKAEKKNKPVPMPTPNIMRLQACV